MEFDMEERKKHNTDKHEAGSAELNFIEFPFALLAENHGGQKTIEAIDSVEDSGTGKRVERKCIVTGSDKWGLPGWFDVDMVLALMKLTAEQSKWKSEYLNFSFYQLREELRLPKNHGGYARRLVEGALRIKGTTICYKNGWRKNGKWTSTEAFSIFDNVRLSNTKEFDSDDEQRIKWNELIVESMQAQFSMGLDWDFYLSLKRPTTKRLGLFLSKRWRHMQGVTYGLKDFCVHKIGLKDEQAAWKYRQSLEVPIAELKDRGFPLEARFDGRGDNSRVVFEKKASKQRRQVVKERPPLESEIIKALHERDVREPEKVLRESPGEVHCWRQIENFDDRNSNGEKKGGGWLASACRSKDGYGFRPGFESNEQRAAKEKAKAERARLEKATQAREQESRDAEVEAEYAPLKRLWAKLSDVEKVQFEVQALRNANSIVAGQYRKSSSLEAGFEDGLPTKSLSLGDNTGFGLMRKVMLAKEAKRREGVAEAA